MSVFACLIFWIMFFVSPRTRSLAAVEITAPGSGLRWVLRYELHYARRIFTLDVCN